MWSNQLFIMKLSDGLWHFIGAIHSQELTDLNTKGFRSYYEAEQTRIDWGYLPFKYN